MSEPSALSVNCDSFGVSHSTFVVPVHFSLCFVDGEVRAFLLIENEEAYWKVFDVCVSSGRYGLLVH